jgi:hypothetical protein
MSTHDRWYTKILFAFQEHSVVTIAVTWLRNLQRSRNKLNKLITIIIIIIIIITNFTSISIQFLLFIVLRQQSSGQKQTPYI